MAIMQSLRTLSVFGLLFSAAALADSTPNQAPLDPKGKFLFTFGVENINFDKEKAYENGIDDTATSLNLEGEYFFHSMVSAGFGITLVQYGDNAGFKVRTEDSLGNQQTSKSDASGGLIFGDVGYKNYMGAGDKFYVTARGGMSFMTSSSRSVSNCSNCPEQDIEVDGGLYGKLGAGARLGNAFHLGIFYTNYFSGDIKNSITAFYSR
jgi:hypothetical protein